MFSACPTRCGFHPESLPPTTPEENGRFLQTVVEKIATIRHDLGSIGDIIAAQVEEREKEANFYQLALPGMEDERQQFQDDTEWLRRKLDYLRGDLDNESEHI